MHAPSPPRSAAPSSKQRVIAVCGMEAEARMARGPGVEAICGGGRSDLLRTRLAAALAAGGAVGLVSFGIAGGLDPALAPGGLVLAAWVTTPGGRWHADARWLHSLTQANDGAAVAGIAGSDEVVATRLAKQRLFSSSGALAVDMESHIVAEMACASGLPFAVIRAVADPAHLELPPAALVSLRPDGRPDVPRVLGALARTPHQLPKLLRAARDARQAFISLGSVRRKLGVGLACPDLLQLMLDVP